MSTTGSPFAVIPDRHLGALLRLALPLALAPFAACTDDTDAGPPDVTSGAYHGFVQTGWRLPHNATEALAIGADVDGDGTVDNQAGSLIGSLAGLGLALDDAGTCTACSPRHWSYRARADAGRQALVAWIEP